MCRVAHTQVPALRPYCNMPYHTGTPHAAEHPTTDLLLVRKAGAQGLPTHCFGTFSWALGFRKIQSCQEACHKASASYSQLVQPGMDCVRIARCCPVITVITAASVVQQLAGPPQLRHTLRLLFYLLLAALLLATNPNLAQPAHQVSRS